MELRAAFDALFDLDDAMAAVVVGATQPALAAIKLAWWRERLQELDDGVVPAEPRLQNIARELLPRGISGHELAGLEEHWAPLLDERPEEFIDGVVGRGPALFGFAARLLGVEMDDSLASAAASFVNIDLGRRGYVDVPGQRIRWVRSKSPRRARPLSALGALARRDARSGGPPFEPEATPGRAWTLLWHSLTGRY